MSYLSITLSVYEWNDFMGKNPVHVVRSDGGDGGGDTFEDFIRVLHDTILLYNVDLFALEGVTIRKLIQGRWYSSNKHVWEKIHA